MLTTLILTLPTALAGMLTYAALEVRFIIISLTDIFEGDSKKDSDDDPPPPPPQPQTNNDIKINDEAKRIKKRECMYFIKFLLIRKYVLNTILGLIIIITIILKFNST